jgi:uncharacterized secreted protein with C-terminal beta-propeller domain
MQIDETEPYRQTTVVGRPGAVYATASSLYIASRHYLDHMPGWYFDETDQIREATTVHKFGLNPATTSTVYEASGAVKGLILNQFSMSEHQTNLRLATTSNRSDTSRVNNTLSVLQPVGPRLELVGELDDIAPTEDIRSVQFNGDVGYVVTFKKTDPLFVIDLKNATNPTIKGELKIPGFSTYMHLMENNHLLTIGYDAQDEGWFAWFAGIQLQIIDVSDLTQPKLVHKEVIGTRGSVSDAATDHLAFNYFAQKELLAIPMIICEGGGDNISGDLMTFSGLLVYRTNPITGFELLGGIPHEEPETATDSWGACTNWWSDPDTKVKRSIFMDDYTYSIAQNKIEISTLEDLETPISSIALQ